MPTTPTDASTSPPMGVERQLAIFQGGLSGKRLSIPISLEALEQRARAVMRPEAFDYVSGGAGAEDTMRANREAFRRWRIQPRVLCDVARRDLRVTILGQELPAPVLLAPLGVQGIMHAEGELATARAARALGVPIILSTVSSFPIERVAETMGPVPKWFQLYWSSDADLTASFLRRAELAGFGAIVVTVDTPHLAWRERDLEHAFLPFLHGHGLANYLSDPVFRSRLSTPPEVDPMPAIQRFAAVFGHPSLGWKDLTFARQHTKLPILLKGILRADDAARAVDAGVDGVVVSNHGGRQVDGSIAALDALPAVVKGVRGRVPVLFDSGIRRGSDAFKALALGAEAVLLGRPYAWGLGVAGEDGVRDVLHNFLADLDLCLALSGYSGPADLDEAALVRGDG